MSSNAADLDDISFNMESVDEMVESIEGNELMCENVESVFKSSNPVNEKMKKEFEKSRDDILSRVPDTVKERFGSICFASFGKFVGPVLVLSPYNVAPGTLRENWLKMFHNCQESGREMTHLVYWYGCSNDLASAYSFQKTSQLLSYEVGFKKVERKILNLRQKSSDGKKIPCKDANLLNGMEEVEIDRKKNPKQRSGYVGFDFLEDYHVSLDEKEYEAPKKEKQKKGKFEKKNNKTMPKSDGNLSQNDSGRKTKTTKIETEAVVQNGKRSKTKKIIKKRSKKDRNSINTSRPKKKVKTVEKSTRPAADVATPNSNDDYDGDGDTRIGGSSERITNNNEAAAVKNPRPSAYDEFADVGEESSHGDTDDENLVVDDLESKDDSLDGDYIEPMKSKESKKKEKKRKKKQVAALPKEQVKKKDKKGNSETKKTVAEEKKQLDKISSIGQLKKEQEKFCYCEQKFLNLVRRWEMAIGNKDADQLSRIYEELLKSIDQFTAPFIEEYSMSDLMKQSKKIVNDKDKWKRVMAKFKQVYTAKKNTVPDGFKAIKESHTTSPIDTENEVTVKKAKSNKKTVSQVYLETNMKSENDGVIIKGEEELDVEDKPLGTIPKSIKECRSNLLDKERKTPFKLESSSQKRNMVLKTDKKKRFSLTKLMRPTCSSNSETCGENHSFGGEISAKSAQPTMLNQVTPSWTLQTMSTEKEKNENRLFGLEFLQQATKAIPENQSINRETTAFNLELAIYNWSRQYSDNLNINDVVKNNNCGESESENEVLWVDRYWNKIHDIAACISGKRCKGTIAGMIAAGKFSTPEKVIYLSDDDLLYSFNGLPLPGFGSIDQE